MKGEADRETVSAPAASRSSSWTTGAPSSCAACSRTSTPTSPTSSPTRSTGSPTTRSALEKRGLWGDRNREPDPGEFWPAPKDDEDSDGDGNGNGRSRRRGGNGGGGKRGIKSAGRRAEPQVTSLRQALEKIKHLRVSIKDRSFCPPPVRERMIPKAGGELRRLGIATVTDPVVQTSLKLVLEPIFEAEFLPCSYGFRPNHRAHDAVAEVRHLTSHSYEWIMEGDLKACLDEISHTALMERVRNRVGTNASWPW
ncbi:reverse transcriptase domain-containing protein [Streptomyces sp. NPDC017991]|uniref:reverse transcriptase domain-containing protein n=1 Tax=Streptomyces sp. NPDC017991 TaxID=3365026 RepID=UPI0037A41BDE